MEFGRICSRVAYAIKFFLSDPAGIVPSPMAATTDCTTEILGILPHLTVRRDMVTCTAATDWIGRLALNILMPILLTKETLPKSAIAFVILTTEDFVPNKQLFSNCCISMLRVLEFD